MHLFTTGHNVCPVLASIYYLNAIPKTNKMTMQPLFTNSQLRPLSRYCFPIWKRIGLNSSIYLPNSLRAGAATAYSAVGVADHLIQTLGCWSCDCYVKNIRTPLSAIAKAHRKLCTHSLSVHKCVLWKSSSGIILYVFVSYLANTLWFIKKHFIMFRLLPYYMNYLVIWCVFLFSAFLDKQKLL